MNKLTQEQLNKIAKDVYNEVLVNPEEETITSSIVDVVLNTIICFMEKYQDELEKQ